MTLLQAIATLGALTFLPCATAGKVRVENPTGSVTVRAIQGTELQVRQSGTSGALPADATVIEQTEDLILVQSRPPEGVAVNLEVDLPHDLELEVKTESGSIDLQGLFRRVDLISDRGDVRITTSWKGVSFSLVYEKAPNSLTPAEGLVLVRPTSIPPEIKKMGRERRSKWNRLDNDLQFYPYSRIEVRVKSPGDITLEDMEIPPEWPVKLHWQAPRVVEDILGNSFETRPTTARSTDAPLTESLKPEDEDSIRFRTDVQMVSLLVSVQRPSEGVYGLRDRERLPLTGLTQDDFQIWQDGVQQETVSFSSEQVPFNLVVLVDLSASTVEERLAMKAATWEFVQIARPQDRVAVYSLSGGVFRVISRLTNDRERLRQEIYSMDEVSGGGTPLYDAVVLACAEELTSRPRERNAMVILTDGMDNQLVNPGSLGLGMSTGPVPSIVSFDDLARIAERVDALLYPVLLDPNGDRVPSEAARIARARLRGLADKSGGWLFVARSARDLDPVYALVEKELRSIYSLGYYPSSKDLDGTWRQVEVRVSGAEALVRTRAGYWAQ